MPWSLQMVARKHDMSIKSFQTRDQRIESLSSYNQGQSAWLLLSR